MTVEVYGSGAYVVMKADGLGELASKVDEYCQQGYAPHGSMTVLAGANLKPTQYLQALYRPAKGA